MTYESIAARFGARLCPGGDDYNHAGGFYDWTTGILHWAPRRVTRRGLYNFLKLVARSNLGTDSMPEPFRTYTEVGWADALAHELGVRFPRRYRELDRARVRAALPGSARVLDKETRKVIARWAR